MRKSASEIINSLESRIAKLEKSSSPKVSVRIMFWEDDTKTNKADKDLMDVFTFKELKSYLKDLDHVYEDRDRDFVILAGYGDFSGNLYEVYIKKNDLLNLLIGESFKEFYL